MVSRATQLLRTMMMNMTISMILCVNNEDKHKNLSNKPARVVFSPINILEYGLAIV